MRHFIFVLAAVFMAAFSTSAAALVVNPGGDTGSFQWDGGLGDSVEFPTFGDDDTLELTLATSSALTFSVLDCCRIGDAFALLVDGASVAWDSITNPGGVGGNFAASVDLVLAAGLHTFDLTVTADCCGIGGGSWTTSPVTAVPVPAAGLLLLGGLGGLVALRRRKTS